MTPAQQDAHNLASIIPRFHAPTVKAYPDGGACLDFKRGGPDDPGGEGLMFNVGRPDQWGRVWMYVMRATGMDRIVGEG